MKRVAAWAFALVLILALSGYGRHTQNGQGTPSNSAEHVDKASQVPKDHHLGGLTSDRAKNHDFISDIYQPNLTLQTLADLVARCGEHLTWADFAPYYGETIGSDLYILRYPIDWDYSLHIGGKSQDSPTMYIRLVSEYNTENYIDVRFDEIDDFISNTPKTSDFSYDEVRSTYEEDDPGVKHSGFHNTSSVALETIQDVLDQAKKECTISYDSVDVSYDGTTSIWQTVFYTEGMVGGSQTVYMDSYGVTCLVVYGE